MAWGRRNGGEQNGDRHHTENAKEMESEARQLKRSLECIEDSLSGEWSRRLKDSVARMQRIVETELNASGNRAGWGGRVRNNFGNPEETLRTIDSALEDVRGLISLLESNLNQARLDKARAGSARLRNIDLERIRVQLTDIAERITNLSHGGAWLPTTDLGAPALDSNSGRYGAGDINTGGDVIAFDPKESKARRKKGYRHLNDYDSMIIALEHVVVDHTVALAAVQGKSVPRWVSPYLEQRKREQQEAEDAWYGRTAKPKPKKKGWFGR